MVPAVAVTTASAVPATVSRGRAAAIVTTVVLGEGERRRGDKCRRYQQSVKSLVRAHGNLLCETVPDSPNNGGKNTQQYRKNLLSTAHNANAVVRCGR
jgi:hypothetical protein